VLLSIFSHAFLLASLYRAGMTAKAGEIDL